MGLKGASVLIWAGMRGPFCGGTGASVWELYELYVSLCIEMHLNTMQQLSLSNCTPKQYMNKQPVASRRIKSKIYEENKIFLKCT